MSILLYPADVYIDGRLGGMDDPLRAVWREMRRRCADPTNVRWDRYGGRGITVCADWLDYETFHAWALAAGYRKGLTIERIDNDGNYDPANCAWITRAAQARNRSSARLLTAFGETKSLIEWVEDPRCVVAYNVLQLRLGRRWDAERAITAPLTNNNGKATHCPQGHPYSPENTQLDDRGWRKCLTCVRARVRAYYAQRREAAAAGDA